MFEFYDQHGEHDFEPRRLLDGNALLWAEGGITFRMETALDLTEAVRVTESLR